MARGPNRAPGVVRWGEVGLGTADGVDRRHKDHVEKRYDEGMRVVGNS
jgi:hypothetical protein